MFNLLTSFN